MAALACDWLKHFSTSSPQPLNGFWRNLTGSKSSSPSIRFVFFMPIGNLRWPPWPVIGWNIFWLLLRNHWMDFDETWQEANPQRPLSSLCFSCRSEIQDGRPGLWLAETFFDFFTANAEWIFTKLDRKQILKALYQVCVFRADRKTKMVALADSSSNVAHCTQVHDMWPFGPLVSGKLGVDLNFGDWLDGLQKTVQNSVKEEKKKSDDSGTEHFTLFRLGCRKVIGQRLSRDVGL